MFTLFLRAMLLYALLIATVRVLGKRQMSELQPYELALTILLAEIIAGPIDSVSTPMLYGLLPVLAVVVVHGIITVACMKSDKIRAFVSGKPTLVIRRGVIDRKELDRLCMSLADLLEGLRTAGYLDPAEVGTAVVEANGNISAFAASGNRPVTTAEMNVDPGYEGMPMILVMDGRVQKHNLNTAGKDEAWLEAQLSARGSCIKGVYLAALDTRGWMHLQLKDGTIIRYSALQPGEVNW